MYQQMVLLENKKDCISKGSNEKREQRVKRVEKNAYQLHFRQGAGVQNLQILIEIRH